VDAEPPADAKDDDRRSGMSIEFALSIRYNRERPDTKGDRIEARMDSIGLLIVGSIVTIIILVILVPRILSAIGSI